MKRILFAFVTLCLLVPVMAGCTPIWVREQDPNYFPGSIWESEDGLVRFTIDLYSDLYIDGTVIKDGVE